MMYKSDKKIFWLAAIVLIVKLSLLPFTQTTDSDAVSRTWLGMGWLQHPVWLTHSVWGPFHFYITGAALSLWHNPIYAPPLLNIILSALMLLPFYFFVKREFNEQGAFVSACLLAVSPIIFRNSLMNMSETPYIFLLAVTLDFLSRGFHKGMNKDYLLAGFFATIGSGIRFEFWIFIAVFTFVVYFKTGKKYALLFMATALLYPITDVLSHFIPDGYTLNGFFSAYPWSMHADKAPDFSNYLRRVWFLPLCWLVSLGPFAFIIIRELAWSRKRYPAIFWCALVFLIFLFITEITGLFGTILLHERFAATIAFLSMPFAAPWFAEITSYKRNIALLFCLLTVGLSYVYNLSDIAPLPRLTDQTGDKVAKLINRSMSPRSGLIVDFWEWENTYYVALQTKLEPENLFVQEGNVLDTVRETDIKSIIDNHKQGVILLVKNSLLWQNADMSDSTMRFKFDDHIIHTKSIYENEKIKVWSYMDN